MSAPHGVCPLSIHVVTSRTYRPLPPLPLTDRSALCPRRQVKPGAVQGAGRDALPRHHHRAARVGRAPGPPAPRDHARRLPGRQVVGGGAAGGRLWAAHTVGALRHQRAAHDGSCSSLGEPLPIMSYFRCFFLFTEHSQVTPGLPMLQKEK